MAQYQFNPFTNNLDLVGTSGGATSVETVNLDSGSISGTTITLSGGTTGLTTSAVSATEGDIIGTLNVAHGGTGLNSTTAYSVVCGGTTSTAALQNVSGVGTAGQVLTSNGAGALPTWQAVLVQPVPITPVSTTPYVVLSTDFYLSVDTSVARTIELPNAPVTGRVFVIKDSSGTATSNNISVTTVGGSVTIDAVTTYTMNQNYGSMQVIFNGTSYEVF